MPAMTTRNPLNERSNMVVLLTPYCKHRSINHVTWGTVMDCSAIFKGSKDAYGVMNIEDACSMGVYLEGYLEQLVYVRLLYNFILDVFRQRLLHSSVLDILVLSCYGKLFVLGPDKLSRNFNMHKRGSKKAMLMSAYIMHGLVCYKFLKTMFGDLYALSCTTLC